MSLFSNSLSRLFNSKMIKISFPISSQNNWMLWNDIHISTIYRHKVYPDFKVCFLLKNETEVAKPVKQILVSLNSVVCYFEGITLPGERLPISHGQCSIEARFQLCQ